LSKSDKADRATLGYSVILMAIIYLTIPEVMGSSALLGSSAFHGNSALLGSSEFQRSSDLLISLDIHNQNQSLAKTVLGIQLTCYEETVMEKGT
jgi:hypothetical protein